MDRALGYGPGGSGFESLQAHQCMKSRSFYLSIFFILISSLVIRLISAYFFSDQSLVHEWGIIIHNHNVSGIFGYHVALNEFTAIPKFAEVGEKVLPTVFMPPLYYYFIFLIDLLNGEIEIVNSIIFIQILLSIFSILVFALIIKILNFSSSTILFTISLFSFLPIYIFSSSQVSSIVLQIFLILCYFYFLLKIEKEINFNLPLFSFFGGLLILTRGEFFIFYILTILYFFVYIEKKWKFLFISSLITLIVISPYIKRNYSYFNTFTLTKSFGYNLLKGNNPSLKVEGDPLYINKNYSTSAIKIKTDNNYELNLDNFYKEKTYKLIKENPDQYFNLYIKKILSFLFLDINSTYPDYYNIFHLLPKILLSILSLIGAIISLRRKNFFQFLSIYYFSTILLFSIFFILPRYNLILLPIQLLLSIKAVEFLKRKIIN